MRTSHQQPGPARRAILLLLSTALLLPAAGAHASQGYSYAIAVNEVQIYPVVKRGKDYVRGLSQEDFEVFDNGQPVPITSFSAEVLSLHVALLIDVSESMAGSLPRVLTASQTFVDELGPDDRLSVCAFTQVVYCPVRRSTDRRAATAAFGELRAEGGTTLYDAVHSVAATILEPNERSVLVVFSDGKDQGSHASIRDTIETALSRGVIVYVLAPLDQSLDIRSRGDLLNLASDTGGEFLGVGRIEELEDIYGRILADLRAQYSLSFTPDEGDPGNHRIDIRVRDRGLKVRHRRGYKHD